MNRLGFGIVGVVMLAACGEKAREARDAANAVAQLAVAGTALEKSQQEAEKFYKERQEKGDTVAMPYAELQKFLPSVPSGYTPAGEPSGSSQSMGGFSMSQVEQSYTAPAAADGNAPSIQVTIVDFGGTQAGYGMLAAPMMMMNYSREDAHSRAQTVKMDQPFTWGAEEYDKDNKTAKVTGVTRYRYVITVEARNQADDQTATVKGLVEEIAKKFAGK